MNRIIPTMTALLLTWGFQQFGSQIQRITLAELADRSDAVVLGEVVGCREEGNRDRLTVRVGVVLKGRLPVETFALTLVSRGGLKDFDPALRKGDTGVFFLKHDPRTGEIEKAYWGGVAVFGKNHFHAQDGGAARKPTVRTRPLRHSSPGRRWTLFENHAYRFVRVEWSTGESALLVYSKETDMWRVIENVSTHGAVFGRSPTFEACRAAGKAPPETGWDFRHLAAEAFTDVPINAGAFRAFPDRITFDPANGTWTLEFMSNWDMAGTRTLLTFSDCDLKAAFGTSARNPGER